MSRVAGEVAIVTGAAKGVGAECARLLAMEGAKVVLTDLDDESREAVADQIEPKGGAALHLRQDGTSAASWPRMFDAVIEAFGVPSILVNNAGIALAKTME